MSEILIRNADVIVTMDATRRELQGADLLLRGGVIVEVGQGLATLGGAQVLGRGDCGSLAVGKRADVAIWDVTGVESAGSWDVAALLLAGPNKVRDLFVEGRQVVGGGRMVTIDLPAATLRQNHLARRLMA